MDRKLFIEIELSRILNIAKPSLVKCEYLDEENGEVCRVHCKNGHTYDIRVEANSLAAIVYDVSKIMLIDWR